MDGFSDLPPPGDAALAHSRALSGLISRRIAERGGWIDFSEYMELALYAPGLGYYSAGATKFGPAGDFVTAPEVSDLFARCLARAIAPVIRRGPGHAILELGAGTGALAARILRTLAHERTLPASYRILEVSADLRERQRRTLAERAPDSLPLVEWLDELPTPFDGVALANEVVDALPFSRFRIGAGDDRVEALGVAAGEDGFRWSMRAAHGSLREAVAAIEAELREPLPEGYRSEVNPNLGGFVGGLGGSLRDGIVLLIDYGLPRRELYSPERSRGTLTCHYRHRAHRDPFLHPGLQDITAWVDFTAIAAAASAAGLRVDGYSTQAQFLIAAGIEDEYLAHSDAGGGDTRSRVERSREVQTLLMPGQMGERFKVIWLSKGAAALAPEFDHCDQRHRL